MKTGDSTAVGSADQPDRSAFKTEFRAANGAFMSALGDVYDGSPSQAASRETFLEVFQEASPPVQRKLLLNWELLGNVQDAPRLAVDALEHLKTRGLFDDTPPARQHIEALQTLRTLLDVSADPSVGDPDRKKLLQVAARVVRDLPEGAQPDDVRAWLLTTPHFGVVQEALELDPSAKVSPYAWSTAARMTESWAPGQLALMKAPRAAAPVALRPAEGASAVYPVRESGSLFPGVDIKDSSRE